MTRWTHDEDHKPVRLTKREARRTALVSAAALIDAHRFEWFDHTKLDEHDDHEAWVMINVERVRLVAMLCKWAKWDPDLLGWESDP